MIGRRASRRAVPPAGSNGPPWSWLRPAAAFAASAIASCACEGVDLGSACPAGAIRINDLCVPERFADECDGDRDGFRAAACGGTDCDDDASAVNPAAQEVCNDADDDCDGDVDEGLRGTYYPDSDGDEYGRTGDSALACLRPPGFAERGGDCDDTNPEVRPDAPEICNALDDDCDGFTDEGVAARYYRDADADGYGAALEWVDSCVEPAGYVTVSLDCDDSDRHTNPGVDEFRDLLSAGGLWDHNCDGLDEVEYPNARVDCATCTGPVVGWAAATVPECGVSGTLVHCGWAPGTGCSETSRATEVQRCR